MLFAVFVLTVIPSLLFAITTASSRQCLVILYILNCLQVLIISYETFRMHASKFEIPGSCDLLICDEAHRLKNDQTLTNKVHQFAQFRFSFFLPTQLHFTNTRGLCTWVTIHFVLPELIKTLNAPGIGRPSLYSAYPVVRYPNAGSFFSSFPLLSFCRWNDCFRF